MKQGRASLQRVLSLMLMNMIIIIITHSVQHTVTNYKHIKTM